MKTVSIHDAKTNLSKYIAAAKRGEKIYIGSFGEAEVVLSKMSDQDKGTLSSRSFSIAKGKVAPTGEAFSEPTEKQVTELLLGN